MNATPKFCAHCGAPLTSNSRFCEHCGQPVAAAQPVAAPAQPAAVPPAQTYPGPPPVMPMQPPPAQPPPRKSRAGCVIAVLLALIVLCCIVPVVGAFALFRFTDIGEIVPTLEAMATEMAVTPGPQPQVTSLVDALAGDDRATATPGGIIESVTDAPVSPGDGDATPQDFVGDWEVVSAQQGDGSPRDDLIGEQIRFMLSDDGETILGVELPYTGPTEPGMWLKVVGGRAAAGEVIDSDPLISVTATLSPDGNEIEMTMRAAADEVTLTLERIGDGQ